MKLASRAGQESSTRERPNSEIIGNIEGLNLDLLLLQNKVQANSNLLSKNKKKIA